VNGIPDTRAGFREARMSAVSQLGSGNSNQRDSVDGIPVLRAGSIPAASIKTPV